MGRKRKTLPKEFGQLIEAGDLSALKGVFERCELDAHSGYSKRTALSFCNIPDELVCWLVEQGADINAVDTYGQTPLHEQAISWCGNIRLFLELGADMEALNYRGETPLHMAAGFFKPKAVRVLVEQGGNIRVKNDIGQNPLAKALAHCNNTDIEALAEIADILLDAGTVVTPDMLESITRIGKQFEFHRENYNKDHLDATDAALLHLYERFNVSPVEKRHTHDNRASITVSTVRWQNQHEELWNLLIPSQGCAKTVQGEVIRITGRVANEIVGNGGVNWDATYKKMLDALLLHFGSATPLDDAVLQEAATLVKRLRNGCGEDEPARRLCELAVRWVLANPNPILLESPDYER